MARMQHTRLEIRTTDRFPRNCERRVRSKNKCLKYFECLIITVIRLREDNSVVTLVEWTIPTPAVSFIVPVTASITVSSGAANNQKEGKSLRIMK